MHTHTHTYTQSESTVCLRGLLSMCTHTHNFDLVLDTQFCPLIHLRIDKSPQRVTHKLNLIFRANFYPSIGKCINILADHSGPRSASAKVASSRDPYHHVIRLKRPLMDVKPVPRGPTGRRQILPTTMTTTTTTTTGRLTSEIFSTFRSNGKHKVYKTSGFFCIDHSSSA